MRDLPRTHALTLVAVALGAAAALAVTASAAVPSDIANRIGSAPRIRRRG